MIHDAFLLLIYLHAQRRPIIAILPLRLAVLMLYALYTVTITSACHAPFQFKYSTNPFSKRTTEKTIFAVPHSNRFSYLETR